MDVAEDIKSKSKRGQKILIQIGVVMIVLFTLLTLAVGNMITMSAFSTSLDSNVSMFDHYMLTLADRIGEYKSLTWLMDYWKENAKELVTEDDRLVETGDLQDVLNKLSKSTSLEVTGEELDSLTDDEKKTFAVGCYKEIQQIFDMFADEEENYGIILTLQGEGEEEPTALMLNYSKEGVILGKTADIRDVKKIIKNTYAAREAEVWKWAFSAPNEAMLFGTNLTLPVYKGSQTAEMLGVFPADLVYKDMKYTYHIRNDVIIMMIVIFVLILLVLYFFVSIPLSGLQKCVTEYAENKDTNLLTDKLSGIRSRNEIGRLADEFSAMALETA